MARVTPSDSNQDHTESGGPPASRRWRAWIPLAVWAALVLGMLLVIIVGSVSTVSYHYNAFIERTFRDVEERSFVDIWSDQVGDLPGASAQWLMNGAFVGSIVVIGVCFAYGAWLLLISSQDAAADASARVRRRART